MALRSVGLLSVAVVAAASCVLLPDRAEAATVSGASQAAVLPMVRSHVEAVPRLARSMAGLSTPAQTEPRGHALISASAGSLPHDVTNGPLNTSTNWSGAIDTGGQSNVFSGVEGNWVVPKVQASATNEASASWIGIDGVTSASLIQTGTAQNTGPGWGGTQYYAWVELLPGAPGIIGNSSGPAPVVPGDVISASITEGSPNLWTIALDDTTQGWSFSQAFSYATPGTTAEWIEEAPTVNGAVSALAHYGSTTFSNLGIAGSDLSSEAIYPTYLLSPSGAIVSYPADFNSSTDSFSVIYGSPQPQITSVSSNAGSTSGGTAVTVSGDFLYGVTQVNFGGVAASFSTDPTHGTVSATAPPHVAGTFDITVTTPGGTSPTQGADQFTYSGPPPPPTPPAPTTPAPAPASQHGYWLVGSDGGIFTFGSAAFFGSAGSLHLQRPVVGIVPTSDRAGYWLDASDGGIFAFGDSGFYGSIPGVGLHPAGSGLPNSLDAPIVGMVPSSDGHGYFMVASDGGVFAFGDARFAGSCPGIGGCSGAAVAVMPDSSGNGYWLVTQTGHVYTFGDAPYFGSPGQLGAVASAVRTPDGQGYWILFSSGAISTFGDAGNFGSPSGLMGGLNPATAIFSTADGAGYWVASANGAVANYGDAPNDGSMLGTHLNGSVIAATGW